MKDWLTIANARPIQGRGGSRDFFFEKERANLSFPQVPMNSSILRRAKFTRTVTFSIKETTTRFPITMWEKRLTFINSNIVHAYFECERIATHKCMKGTYHWSTNPAHYPDKKYVEFNYHLGSIKKQATRVGNNTSLLVERLIAESRYPL